MGKPLKNIVYTIKEELSGYKITDDTLFEDAYLVDKINGVREVLIAEQFRNKYIDPAFYQQLCCLEVLCDKSGCIIEGEFYPSGNNNHYLNIPSLINKVGFDNILYLGLDDMLTQFTRTTTAGYVSSEGALWTKRGTIYLVLGDKILIKNLPNPGIKYLCMLGLLSDPTKSCNYDENEDYPVPDIYKLELLVKKDIMSVYGIVGDEINDARDIKGVLKQAENQGARQRNEEE
jgi:hypothetical protein